jgi:hypothetical protein
MDTKETRFEYDIGKLSQLVAEVGEETMDSLISKIEQNGELFFTFGLLFAFFSYVRDKIMLTVFSQNPKVTKEELQCALDKLTAAGLKAGFALNERCERKFEEQGDPWLKL